MTYFPNCVMYYSVVIELETFKWNKNYKFPQICFGTKVLILQ